MFFNMKSRHIVFSCEDEDIDRFFNLHYSTFESKIQTQMLYY